MACCPSLVGRPLAEKEMKDIPSWPCLGTGWRLKEGHD